LESVSQIPNSDKYFDFGTSLSQVPKYSKRSTSTLESA
jgi:hypothetical protein